MGMTTGPDVPGAPMWIWAAGRSTTLYTREVQLMVWAPRSNVHCANATAALLAGGTSNAPDPLPCSTTCCAARELVIVNAITAAQQSWVTPRLSFRIIVAPLLSGCSTNGHPLYTP